MLKRFLLLTVAIAVTAAPCFNATNSQPPNQAEDGCSIFGDFSGGRGCHSKYTNSTLVQTGHPTQSNIGRSVSEGGWSICEGFDMSPPIPDWILEKCNKTDPIDPGWPTQTPQPRSYVSSTSTSVPTTVTTITVTTIHTSTTSTSESTTVTASSPPPTKTPQPAPTSTYPPGKAPCTASSTALKERFRLQEEVKNGLTPDAQKELGKRPDVGRHITFLKDLMYQLRVMEQDASFRPRAFTAEFTEYLRARPDHWDSLYANTFDYINILTIRNGYMDHPGHFLDVLRLHKDFFRLMATTVREYLCEVDAAHEASEVPPGFEVDGRLRWVSNTFSFHRFPISHVCNLPECKTFGSVAGY
jgi:hypothetical protein